MVKDEVTPTCCSMLSCRTDENREPTRVLSRSYASEIPDDAVGVRACLLDHRALPGS